MALRVRVLNFGTFLRPLNSPENCVIKQSVMGSYCASDESYIFRWRFRWRCRQLKAQKFLSHGRQPEIKLFPFGAFSRHRVCNVKPQSSTRAFPVRGKEQKHAKKVTFDFRLPPAPSDEGGPGRVNSAGLTA